MAVEIDDNTIVTKDVYNELNEWNKVTCECLRITTEQFHKRSVEDEKQFNNSSAD